MKKKGLSKDDPFHTGDKLRQLRVRDKHPLERVAAELGVGKSTLSDYERGVVFPYPEVAYVTHVSSSGANVESTGPLLSCAEQVLRSKAPSFCSLARLQAHLCAAPTHLTFQHDRQFINRAHSSTLSPV